MAKESADPFFLAALDLNGRLCAVFGDSEETLQRAQSLQASGARLRIVCAHPSPELSIWSGSLDTVELLTHAPTTQDLEGAWLAIVTEVTAPWVPELAAAADARQIFFCAVDRPEHNSFAHVALAQAGALRIGISTSGAVPALAGALRARLQRLLDEAQFATIVERLSLLRANTPRAERGALLRRLTSRLRLEGSLTLELPEPETPSTTPRAED